VLRRHQVVGELLEAPAFTPDGSAVVYSRFAQELSGGMLAREVLELILHDLRSSEARRLALDGSYPAVSPDGARLAFVRVNPADYAQSLWEMRLDGGGERLLVDESGFSALYYPRYAPNGLDIAFAGSAIPKLRAGLQRPARHGLPCDIYLVRAGQQHRRVGEIAEDNPAPRWRDERTLVVFGTQAVYTLDVASGEARRLLEPGGIGGGDWRGA
jgi:Tol biopolymer transport system component